jgi:DNA-binding CsgD family transcriptional regulator
LTGRQREILQLIAEGQNTKGIAELLKVSPKTVEYHRMKLMNCLNVHDIPGLVRFALRVGDSTGKLTGEYLSGSGHSSAVALGSAATS